MESSLSTEIKTVYLAPNKVCTLILSTWFTSALARTGDTAFLKCKFTRKCWQELRLKAERLELLDMRSSRDMNERILNMPKEGSTMILILL
jgi:hypothetical protein